MKTLIQFKTTIPPVLVWMLLVCIGLLPKALAVVPPPDGGYPGFTTAEGQNALFSLTTGAANTAVGWHSLFSDTEGSFNTATGAGALVFNTADQNTAVGAAALLFNTDGFDNTAIGAAALLNNNLGIDNTALGANALFSNGATTGDTATGGPGSANTAVGSDALFSNTTGAGNTASGAAALQFNTTGGNDTACGVLALSANTSGSFNTALGRGAGSSVTTANNVIAIGISAENVSNSCYIGQIYSNVQPIVGTDPDSVTITSTGRLGRGNVSSRRYKHDIQPMDKTSEAIYALKPVSFRYNKEYDATQTLAFGLIAEEVAEVYPDLVGRNPNGEPESVRYEQINAMLLNEFLKEHHKNEEQGATIALQRQEINALQTELKKQASQIQKVSAQLELSKPAPQTVLNTD